MGRSVIRELVETKTPKILKELADGEGWKVHYAFMNYDQFRMLWHEAVDAAGLMPSLPQPLEAVHLDRLSRTYERPSWCWARSKSARSTSLPP